MKTMRFLLVIALLCPTEAVARTHSLPRRWLLAQRDAGRPTQATQTPGNSGNVAQTRPTPATNPTTTPRPNTSDAGVRPTTPANPTVTTPVQGTTPGTALTAAQVVANMQAFYARTTDFEAEFVNVSRNRLAGSEQRRTGRVRFQKPGRMRWDYTDPTGDVIVSDGATLWAYQAAERLAVQSNLQQSQLPSALSFLMGTGDLARDFSSRMLDARQAQYPNGYVLELRPITPNPSFERIIFYIEPTNFQVARVVILDAQGNSNRFDFLSPRVNLNHARTIFQWTPPQGTQVNQP